MASRVQQNYQTTNPLLLSKKELNDNLFFENIEKQMKQKKPFQTIYNQIIEKYSVQDERKKKIINQLLYFYELKENYFENVRIIDATTGKFYEKELFSSLFFMNNSGKDFIIKMNDLEIFSDNTFSVLNQKTNQWRQCKRECAAVLEHFINSELSSTAFILRVIFNSLVKAISSSSSSSSYESIYILYNNPRKIRLTGNWDDDKQFFSIESTYKGNARLILGFGPSASGKTYWTRTVISLFREKLVEFPQVFLSIDGGLVRELSMIYQMILNQIKLSNFNGLVNLVNPSAFSLLPNLFNSDKVKNKLISFLRNNPQKISLYVPLTLGGCLRDINCRKSYQKYIDITKDESWIGLMIFQHKLASECDYREGFKCKSTTVSGTSRQIQQGKKYSSGAYSNSMRNGLSEMKKSTFCTLLVHNSGGLKNNQSLMIEYPKGRGNNKFTLIKNGNEIIQKENFLIIPNKLEKQFLQMPTF